MSPRHLCYSILLVVPCVGCWGARPSPDYFDSRAALEAFLNDLSTGKIEAAYARTSPRYQQEYDLDSFKAWINKSPTLGKRHTIQFDNMHGEIWDKANVHVLNHWVTITFDNDSEEYQVDLVKEYDTWKVDQVLPWEP